MSQNRYTTLSTGIPVVNPLKLNYTELATPVLYRQKAYEDATNSLGAEYDALLKVPAIAPDDKEYVKQKRQELDSFMNQNVDWSDPVINRQMKMYMKQVAYDPRLDAISKTTAAYMKTKEDYDKAAQQHKILPQNTMDYTAAVNKWLTPGSGGSWDDSIKTKGFPTWSEAVDEPTEKDKYFSQLKGNGTQWYEEAMKHGWEGISDPRIKNRVGQVWESYYASSPAADQVRNTYKWSTPKDKQSEKDMANYVFQDFLEHGKGFEYGKSTQDFDSGYATWGEKKSKQPLPRVDYSPYQNAPGLPNKKLTIFGDSKSLLTIPTGKEVQVPGGPRSPLFRRQGTTSQDTDNLPAAEQEKYIQSTLDNMNPKLKDLWMDLGNALAPNGSLYEKAKKVNEHLKTTDPNFTATFAQSNIPLAIRGDKNQTLDLDTPEDQSYMGNIITNSLESHGSRLISLDPDERNANGVFNLLTGEDAISKLKTKDKLDFKATKSVAPESVLYSYMVDSKGNWINTTGAIKVTNADNQEFLWIPPISTQTTPTGLAGATAQLNQKAEIVPNVPVPITIARGNAQSMSVAEQKLTTATKTWIPDKNVFAVQGTVPTSEGDIDLVDFLSQPDANGHVPGNKVGNTVEVNPRVLSIILSSLVNYPKEYWGTAIQQANDDYYTSFGFR